MDPTGSRVVIRGAKLGDIETLQRIELASFDQDRLSRRSLRHHILSDTASVMIASLEGAPVGYAMVFYRATSPIARLYSIATLAEARGKGVARTLLDASESAARRAGRTVLRLEVKEGNAAAIGLYERSGYHAFGRHEAYYEDGAPAIRMEKTLTKRSDAPRRRPAALPRAQTKAA